MPGPTTQPKQNVRTNNTTKTKCQDQQHNQNKMQGPTTQPKQNTRTINTTKTKCQDQLLHHDTTVSKPPSQPDPPRGTLIVTILGPRNRHNFRDTPGVNCRRSHIELSANHVWVFREPIRFMLGPKFAPAQNLGRPISFQRGPIKRALLIGANHIGTTSNCLSAVPTLSIYAQMVPTLAMFGTYNIYIIN